MKNTDVPFINEQIVQKLIDMKVDFEPSTSEKESERTGTLATLVVVALFFLLSSFLGTSYFFLWLIAETGNIAVLLVLAWIL